MRPRTAGSNFSTPAPVSADSVTTGMPLICARMSPAGPIIACRAALRSATASHLFSASTQARPSRSISRAICRSCSCRPSVASTASTTTSAIFSASIAALTDIFSSACSIRARRRSPAVSTSSTPPLGIAQQHRHRIAGQAGLRPGDHPLLAQQAVQQRGFAGIRPADDGQLQRPRRPPVARLRRARRQPIGDFAHQIGDALAMLGRHRQRLAQAQRIRLQRRVGRRRRPSALFATSSTGRPCRRSQAAKCGSAGVMPARASTTNSTRSACATAARRTRAHAPGQRLRRRFLQPRGVDQAHRAAAQHRLRLLAVARDAGRVGHQRAAPPGQPVEQRGLADIRAAGDDDGREHDRGLTAAPPAVPSSVMT